MRGFFPKRLGSYELPSSTRSAEDAAKISNTDIYGMTQRELCRERAKLETIWGPLDRHLSRGRVAYLDGAGRVDVWLVGRLDAIDLALTPSLV